MVSFIYILFIYIDQIRIRFPRTFTLIMIFKIKFGDEDFGGKDRYTTLALEKI